MSDPSMGPARCSRCGADLPPQAPERLCPACVVAAVARPVSDLTGEEPTKSPPATGPTGVAGQVADNSRLHPGQPFGPYRIDRLLGRGGMGEVYEAEHVEQGRRVALKVLNQRLTSPDDRARFLLEGRLAASINHPHSIYIFGSEDVAGTPVIAMELLPGGTLNDRVRAHGPLRPAEAVEVILQVIAGLEAAQNAGILHRDIKPSNCFIDRDGTVKVGDFGLSISTVARGAGALATPVTFQGTPEYASPEQRRGQAIDVRADIYSVGATLYFLLTGQPPGDFAAPAPLAGLASLVRRLLANEPSDRPATYARLIDELRRLSSAAATAGTIGLRLAAGAFDWAILVGATILGGLLMGSRLNAGLHAFPYLLMLLVSSVLYWGVIEGLWGTSYGKRAVGLRVVTAGGERPGITRAMLRSVLFVTPVLLTPALSAYTGLLAALASLGGAGGMLLSTARPRNGFAGLHEILSGTRVVRRQPAAKRLASAAIAPLPPTGGVPECRVGPFDVVAPLGATDRGKILLAFDPRLARPAWIHVVPPHTAPVPALVRDLNRPGRLHWLNGQRTELRAWDAYDAQSGAPLMPAVGAAAGPHPWCVVRRWLRDLARELEAGLDDGSLESLSLDRVWVASEGRVKLLDFRAPGAQADAAAAAPVSTASTVTTVSAQRFLSELAQRALGSSMTRLPLSASSFLQRLAGGEFGTMAEVARTLDELMTQPGRVTHRQRGMALALGLLAYVVGAAVLANLLADGPGLLLGSRDVAFLGSAVIGVAWAIAQRGGFWLRAFRIAVVTSDGREVSRVRAASRALVAWSWVPAGLVAAAYGLFLVHAAVSALKLVGLVWAADCPERGLHDRLAGTYLVPR